MVDLYGKPARPLLLARAECRPAPSFVFRKGGICDFLASHSSRKRQGPEMWPFTSISMIANMKTSGFKNSHEYIAYIYDRSV